MTARAPGFPDLLNRLRVVRARRLSLRLLAAGAQTVGAASALLLTGCLIELLLRPEPWLRMAVALGVLLPATLVAAVFAVRRALAGGRLRETARRVQAAHPVLGSRLEGALDLARQREPSTLVLAALEQTASASASLDFAAASRLERPLREAALPLVPLAALVLLFLLLPDTMQNALSRLVLPQRNTGVVGAVRLVAVEPGDVEIVEGDDLPVAVVVDPGLMVRDARLMLQRPDDEKTPQDRRMGRTDEDRFAYVLREIREPVRYAVQVDDSVSRWFQVRVVPRPKVTEIGGRVTPPAYTGIDPFALEGGDGAVRAPVGSRVDLLVQTNHAVREAICHLSTGATTPLQAQGNVYAGGFDVSDSGTYTLGLLDERGHTNANPQARPVHAIPDRLPALILRRQGSGEVSLEQALSLTVEAGDDYGLREVRLHFTRNRRGEPQRLKTWSFPTRHTGRGEPVTLPFELLIERGRFDVGDRISVTAEGTDFGPGDGRIGRSASLDLTVVDPTLRKRESVKALERALQAVEKLLKTQVDLHKATAELGRRDANGAAGAQLLARQNEVRAGAIDAAALLADEPSSAAQRIRQVLKGLAGNELATAVSALQSATKAPSSGERLQAVQSALPAQAEAILRFRQILAILPELQEEAKDPAAPEKGTDPTPQAVEAVKKLQEDLAKFRDEQKKVLDAAEDLTKKPVDDFSDLDKKKLDDLRAAEENLRNFLKDMQSDLSKIPPQDFSNPSLLGETLTILEEVELAEGALTDKEVIIATTAATTGVELAESMTTHLEKWLSDKADRVSWQMEEPLSDFEVPMAELPDKLEDIVGELIEEEEDLMAEAEDMSSSWADSLDKGAGWDAADGPMSNYSAQGVTGNTMPNNTEIGGRSGEGRQGRSHGEMVGDTAVGKGGRKTPARLTPDAFEAGQINDQSTDASGGATGGGKGGAAGAEGLEGPAPNRDDGPLPRLLGRQAELRNKAERINLNLKLQGYNTALLENTLAEMRSVEDELKSGKYQTALRRRSLLVQQMKDAQSALVDEAEVRSDAAAGLPRDLQRELMDAVDAGLPEGYEDLVRGYYERLAQE